MEMRTEGKHWRRTTYREEVVYNYIKLRDLTRLLEYAGRNTQSGSTHPQCEDALKSLNAVL